MWYFDNIITAIIIIIITITITFIVWMEHYRITLALIPSATWYLVLKVQQRKRDKLM